MGNAAIQFGKVAVAGVATAATSIGFLTKQSVDAYAAYEQLKGGVETLFGAGGRTLEKYAEDVGKSVDDAKKEYEKLITAQTDTLKRADEAWINQGMSANQYIETVTSFSASLIQSLNGDTLKASKVADQAITDMADNANKMGTSMEMIQNAYQGFAKQNFMMLDNLKLGYGGTKGEMERLLADAEKIKRANGEMVNYSIDSFADMVEAIHVVQDELGITGTTTEEAAGTIEGSANAMKAAWANLMIGLADDSQNLDVLMQNFVTSVDTYANNIKPKIDKIFKALPNMIKQLAPNLVGIINDILPQLLMSAVSLFDGLIGALPDLFNSLVNGIKSNTPTILKSFQSIVKSIVKIGTTFVPEFIGTIKDGIPAFVNGASNMMSKFGEGIKNSLPKIVSNALDMIEGFIDTIAENLPTFLKAGMDMLGNIAQGIMDSLPTLIEKVPTIISKIANLINDNMPMIFQKGFDIVVTIGKGLIDAIPTLISNIPQILQAIWDAWTAWNWWQLGSNLITGIKNGIQAAGNFLKQSVDDLFNGMNNIVQNIFTKMSSGALNIWRGLSNGLSNIVNGIKTFVVNIFKGTGNTATSIWNAMKTSIGNIVNGIKNTVFNIFNAVKDNVSNVFSNIKNTASTIWEGVKNAIMNPIETAKNFVRDGIEAIKGFFKFEFKWPHIPLPHFSLSGSLNPFDWGSNPPRIGVEWYAKGGILEQPTAFGINPYSGKMMVGGEAGPEAIAPISELMDYVRAAVAESNNGMADILNRILALLADLLPNMNNQLILDTGVLVGEIAPQMDEELGRINDRKGR